MGSLEGWGFGLVLVGRGMSVHQSPLDLYSERCRRLERYRANK